MPYFIAVYPAGGRRRERLSRTADPRQQATVVGRLVGASGVVRVHHSRHPRGGDALQLGGGWRCGGDPITLNPVVTQAVFLGLD